MAVRIKATVKLDRAAINRLTRSPAGPVGQGFRRAGDKTVNRARGWAPVRTGAYRRSIRVERIIEGPNGPVCVIVADAPYARSIEYRQFPVLRQALARLRPSDLA